MPVRRIDVRDVDDLLDARRPGERPVIQQLLRGATEYVKDPVLREVIRAHQQGVPIPQRANRWIDMLTDAVQGVIHVPALGLDNITGRIMRAGEGRVHPRDALSSLSVAAATMER